MCFKVHGSTGRGYLLETYGPRDRPRLGKNGIANEGTMKRFGKSGFLFLAGCVLGAVLGQAIIGYSQDSSQRYSVPRGVHVDLTSDFYRALQEGDSSTKTYSNDPSLNYLREIAIASRFTVETNLQVLKNQERLIQLLESRRK